ncbi:hypothetical protein BGX34_008406, partial [Mortierella sp. NVP85]
MCEIGSGNQSAFNRAVFMMNCLHYVQSVLVYPITKNKADDIEKQIQEYADIVVGEQKSGRLYDIPSTIRSARCITSGIAPIIHAMETKDEQARDMKTAHVYYR